MAVKKCPNVNNVGGDGCNGHHVGGGDAGGDSSSDGDGVGVVAIVLMVAMAMLLVVMVILRGFVVVQMVFVVL